MKKNNHFIWFRLKSWLMIPVMVLLVSHKMTANVTLPYILSDNMVLQRDVPVHIWGWADPGEKVSVAIHGQKVSVKAGINGEWMVKLQPLPAGGPYELAVKGKNTLVLKNILAGDVWVCSGQSNMEWPLMRSRNWTSDKNTVDQPNIRLFYVPKKINLKPMDNTLEARWELCNDVSASGFSAIGYYFGKNLSDKLNVPIGLINSNWGGTDIETWMSLETLYGDKDYATQIGNMSAKGLDELQDEAEKSMRDWQRAVTLDDPGITGKWYAGDVRSADWKTMKLPQAWEGAGLPNLDGVVWFTREFLVSETDAEKEVIISLGPIDDSDESYLNGVKIGKTEARYDLPRLYKVPAGVLKAGTNVITIKVIDTGGGGGLWGMDSQLYAEISGNKINLAGDWHYRVAVDIPAPKATSSPNSFPSLLYNGMINPIVKFPIKGVIWYQGENNTGNFTKYRSLFPALIRDWRNKWNIGDFTFLYVQLANYMEASSTPQESTWAGLREAQTMTLSEPKTGMAVIIDIGEAKDIHPRNKDDVGYRLSLAALKVAYGRDIVYTGPLYKSMKIEGNNIILDFNGIGSGLVANDRYGYLKAFAVAGEDRKFVWAQAYITPDNKVVVSSDEVKAPIAVRYAWANNPDDANLYNAEGLPASPFRTDSW
jgi:sialate O-acetylesterase